MIYVTPWEKLVEEQRLNWVSRTDAAELYWNSDIKTPEIGEAYLEGTTARNLIELVGPAWVEGCQCGRCSGLVYVYSRTDALDRLKRMGEWDKLSKHYARWADPFLCKDCQKAVYTEENGERDAAHRREWEERERRQRELRFMPYQEFLKTAEWQETRQNALKRARFMCQACSAGGTLHVHHRTYVRRGAEYASDLIVLCAECHETFHERRQLADGGSAAK